MGNVDWSDRHDDTDFSGATDLAIGTGDEITVTGYSFRSGAGQDYETLKYSSDGNLVWSVRYDSAEGSSDEAYDVALSPLGDTIVTGRSYQAATSYDIFTIAYGAEEPDPFGLAARVLGAGTGAVTSDPAALDCGGLCQEALPTDLEVDLFATPTAGSSFVGWDGDPDCADGSVTIDSDVVCEAEFDFVGAQDRMLIVDVASLGTVTSHPSGLSCPASCAADYVHTTAVTLSVSPQWAARDWAWSGDADCVDGVVTMTAETHCTGTFLPEPSQGALLAGGLLGLVVLARRGRRCRKSCGIRVPARRDRSPTANIGLG
jgi:hypothetical protein